MAIASSEHCLATIDGKASTEYAVMIDAGSSGSRVHVYKFRVCHEPLLESEVFRMLSPGLSSYKDDPEASARSLKELLDVAVESVPEDKHSCTPIAVKATAGLRMLGAEKSEKILEAVRKYLGDYPFPIAGENGVEIMEGKDEGVYAWVTVNYLLGKLKKEESSAVFDLGGASTQIVFEPRFMPSGSMAEGEHKYKLNYHGGVFNLYQHSYLGYGLNEARKQVKLQMISMQNEEKSTVEHPCLPDGYEELIEHKNANVTLVGTGAGHASCRNIIEKIFQKEKMCNLSPCAFDGVYQPPLIDTFKNRELYVFSYFYDLTQPLGMPSEFSVRELGEMADRVCNGEKKPFRHMPNALDEIEKDPNYCLNLSYAYSLLRFGYDIPSERLVRTAKKINNAETGWSLGASIAMLDQTSLCKA
ncbi:nucleoside phosphatase GDA1/CD39 [Sporodiniella umbellata]|nr:nucleoside phosphatase GDA1/CD39 [Sporodiniella umbellata]